MDIEFREKKNTHNILVDDKIIDNDGFEYHKHELNEDNIMTIEAQMRKINFIDNKTKGSEISVLKKVIMCGLYDLGMNVLTNTSQLKPYEKETLQEKMNEYNNLSIEEINNKFYKVCNNGIFDVIDYSKLPVYDV